MPTEKDVAAPRSGALHDTTPWWTNAIGYSAADLPPDRWTCPFDSAGDFTGAIGGTVQLAPTQALLLTRAVAVTLADQ